MNITFENKTVLVTGATRGIGKAIANEFETSKKIIITGTNRQNYEEIMQNFKQTNIEFLEVDFSNSNSTEKFIEDIEKFDKIDVCINNAGINILNEFTETKVEDYHKILDVNLKGPYLLNRLVAKKMKNNSYGRIVNICSIWSRITRAERSLYTMTKNALHGMTQTMSVELSKFNVLVNSVSPGFTITELTKRTNTEEELRQIAQNIPIKRLAEPNEIARVVAFLSSEMNTYLTGQNITVDGGYEIV
ncbi:MAG: SDR family oxidoreductase [Melioribacteraceae bacterium]|nr:SDR family oxidoreductase [Melioribacteraceae bacterium]MCF8263489.1 SDR family oxidoreductase [Melioribacteraceae bacterium]